MKIIDWWRGSGHTGEVLVDGDLLFWSYC